MSMLSNLSRHVASKGSSLTVCVVSNKTGMTTNVLICSKNIKYPRNFSSLSLPSIQSSIIFTSQMPYSTTKPESSEKNDEIPKSNRSTPEENFASYEKAARNEGFHFKNQHDKSSALIAVTNKENKQDYLLPHPIWSEEEVESVQITHKQPRYISDKFAYYAIQFLRKTFDIGSGYTIGKHLEILDERAVLIRCIFLETVAAVPGFTAALIRHLHSLRRLQRDHGWIHTLLEEAENERMHLLTFLQLRKPGPIFRVAVIFTQYFFTAGFFLSYLISPNFCHRAVGYLEEEAVKTYTHILDEMEAGRLPMWRKLQAPDIAITYWQLPKNGTMRDLIMAIRADEAHHRDVNHVLGSMRIRDRNPFKAGE